MRSVARASVLVAAALALAAAGAQARAQAQDDPHVGYAYPAGGRQGTAFEVTIGGQHLDGVSAAHFSGAGIRASVVKHRKPPSQKQVNLLRMKLQEMREARQREGGGKGGRPIDSAEFAAYAKSLGLDDMDVKAFAELGRKLADPLRQANAQIAETVTLGVTLSADAEPGERELRLWTPAGLSNPLRFVVGQDLEHLEKEPNEAAAGEELPGPLPLAVNGQILPGDVDRFRFKARKGMRLVVAVAAQGLIPYLADAVPGWFQATVKLSDAKGKEVAYADDFRFHPDPTLRHDVPEDGAYVLEVKDSLFRGREDFVYRITLGEVPLVTSIFPLGGRAGAATTVEVQGWNLPVNRLVIPAEGGGARVATVSVRKGSRASNAVPFALDTLPECLEREPDDDARAAQRLDLPVIVNGRIDRPGDRDVFSFEGRAGDEVVAEVQARRLESPLDSVLRLTDKAGAPIAANDDCEDKGAGLTTHQADSRLAATLPASGTYLLHLGDTQQKGGPEYGYRLRVGPRRPDFALRVVPSTVNARAGSTVPIAVYALRRDGYAGEISLRLKDAPPEFALSGGRIPPGRDRVLATLTVPVAGPGAPTRLQLEGCAAIGGEEACRAAVPADDMMQAFIYHHLVPAKEWLAATTGRDRRAPPVRLLGAEPVKLPAGGTALVRLAAPKGPFLQRIELEVVEPAEGIAVKSVSPDPQGVAILLGIDPAKVRPGLEGNLIIGVFRRGGGEQKDQKPKAGARRAALETLPAFRFVVGEREQEIF